MSKYSVKKPITVLMGILIIVALGLFSAPKLPVTLFPEIELPFLVTITTFQGASPEEVEAEISQKIESAVSTIGNFEEVSSRSSEHFSLSVITFSDAANMDSIMVELRELLDNIIFADGIDNTRILRISPDMIPVMTVTLFREHPRNLTDEEILISNTEWLNQDVMLELTSIEGVADVNVSGTADIVLQINLDQTIIASHGLSHDVILAIIEEQNVGGLIGVALDSGEIRMLHLGNAPSTLADIKALPITVFGGEVVALEDLVVDDGIKYINANNASYSKINGVHGIQVSFQKQSDYGITEVTELIRVRLDEIVENEEMTAGYSVLLDQGEYINKAINSVVQNIVIGAILAVIILFIFLKDVRPTLIVSLAIPISVIAALMLMYFSNVSLNIVSMGGLALGVGMLVDNSIVVIENIYRMISEGKTKTIAAIEGAKQVAGAITSSTITTIAVFVPVLFVEGMISDIFLSMALTIAYSLLASLVIALTLVPSAAAKFFNDKNKKAESKTLLKMQAAYKKAVTFSIKYKGLSLLSVLLILIISVGLVVSKGFIMFPDSDEGIININIEMTQQTTFDIKAEYADHVTNLLLEIDNIEYIATTIDAGGGLGFIGMMQRNTGIINFTINLDDNRSKTTDEYIVIIEDILLNINFSNIDNLDASQIVKQKVDISESGPGFMGSSGINVKVSGHDLLTLEKIGNELTAVISNIEGIESTDNGIDKGSDSIKIKVNNNNAMALGLTNQDVIDNVAYLYTNMTNLGQAQTTTVTINGIDYEIDLPNEAVDGVLEFSAFGDYEMFLSGVQLFDDNTRKMIDAFILETGTGIYVPNMMLPTYQDGDPLQFIVNPFLRVINGEIVFNPMSTEPTLASLSVAPLFEIDQNISATQIQRVTGFSTINTDGTNRFINVTAQIEDDKNVTLISADVASAVNNYLESEQFKQHGSGYTVTLAGEGEEIVQMVKDLAIAALVAILLVYMIMAIQFQSLVYPVIILATIPLAFTGGMIAILVTNNYLSVVSIMGLIFLIGIVVNNGIVLIDYINKLRQKGYSVQNAIIKGGQTRLRPVLMTTLTTILALLAMAVGFGQSDELLQPMAITAIGGLIYATVLTLVIVPTMYALFNSKKMKEEVLKDAKNKG